MTVQEKFNQILSILPADGSSIDVVGAPLCTDNDWTDHTIRSLSKIYGDGCFCLKYRTLEHNLFGTIDIYSDYQSECYEADTVVLYAWLKRRGFFGDKYDRNLF